MRSPNDNIMLNFLKEIFLAGLPNHPEWKPLLDNWDEMAGKFYTEEEWGNIVWDNPVEDEETKDISDLCRRLHGAGVNFDTIFASLASGEKSARVVFLGLVRWLQTGDKPEARGREDLALHFIFGGAIQAVSGFGKMAGILKEKLDAMGFGTPDITDEQATAIGALFADVLDKNRHMRDQLAILEPSIRKALTDYDRWSEVLEAAVQAA